MKRLITFITFSTLVSLTPAAPYYTGPQDRMPPGQNFSEVTLGLLAQLVDVGAVADVFETGMLTNIVDTAPISFLLRDTRHPGEPWYPDLTGHLYLKVRVVNAIYGCTNGQELVVMTSDPVKLGYRDPERGPLPPWAVPQYDPLFEYLPTNHSRIVFAAGRIDLDKPDWTPKTWDKPPEPEVIVTNTAAIPCVLGAFTRSWWYDGYQDNLPYTHLTNLVHAARIERNWTNFYYICRDAVPTPASLRVYSDAFEDLDKLSFDTKQSFYDFMLNDPLYPAECREMLESNAEYVRPDDDKFERLGREKPDEEEED